MTHPSTRPDRVGWTGPAEPELAVSFFAARMSCLTDVTDVHAALESADPGLVLVDTRGEAAWQAGHIRQALHLPTDRIPELAPRLLAPAVPVVTYCWGPGCNGATRAALALSRLGYRVREMVGGLEYWIREGLPVACGDRLHRRPADPLTTVSSALRCDC